MARANYPSQHGAIIMDGNARWAKKRGLPRIVGHKAGGEHVFPVAKLFAHCGVEYLTLFAFSTENWNRPRIEVVGLLNLLARKINRETQAFHGEDIRLIYLGKLDRVPTELRQRIESTIELSRGNN